MKKLLNNIGIEKNGFIKIIDVFLKKNKQQYKKIIIKNNNLFQENTLNYTISNKKNINNPNTMYAYQKIE